MAATARKATNADGNSATGPMAAGHWVAKIREDEGKAAAVVAKHRVLRQLRFPHRTTTLKPYQSRLGQIVARQDRGKCHNAAQSLTHRANG